MAPDEIRDRRLRVTALDAIEFRDSQGRDLVEVMLAVGDARVYASVPGSEGRAPDVEGREGAERRRPTRRSRPAFAGDVAREIGRALVDLPLPAQRDLDGTLVSLIAGLSDPVLGSSITLGVSIAAARARAVLERQSLHESLAHELGGKTPFTVPVPAFRVIRGDPAHHALPFRGILIVPDGLASFAAARTAAAETHRALASILADRGLAALGDDETGILPRVAHPTEALNAVVEAIEVAGYRPGEHLTIGIDAGADAFCHHDEYHLAGATYDSPTMVATYVDWKQHYPLSCIIDGLAAGDLAGWSELTRRLGARLHVVTSGRIGTGATRGARVPQHALANGVMIDLRRARVVSDVEEAVRAARGAKVRSFLSYGAGESDSTFLADLAVALGIGHVVAGPPVGGDWVAKFNRIERIERALAEPPRNIPVHES